MHIIRLFPSIARQANKDQNQNGHVIFARPKRKQRESKSKFSTQIKLRHAHQRSTQSFTREENFPIRMLRTLHALALASNF